MTRAVVIGPRLLNDRDIKIADQVPVAIVLTNATDVVHTEMHLRAGRLHLTPSDAIVIDDRLADSRFFAPWIDLLPLRPDGLSEFMARDTTTSIHPVPGGFETLPKSALSNLAVEMRKLKLAQYDCVIGGSPTCRSLTGVICNLASFALAEIEALPPDIICVEPQAVDEQLAAHPECRMLICPVIIDDATPVEMVNLAITTAVRLPVNLVQVVSGHRLPHSRVLTCLIYVIG